MGPSRWVRHRGRGVDSTCAPRRSVFVAGSVLSVVLAAATPAHAQVPEPPRGLEGNQTRDPVVVWPTLTPAGDEATPIALHKPTEAEAAVFARSQELDATLRDAAQDLGLSLQLADRGPEPGHARDADVIERASRGGAHGTWVVSPRLESSGGDGYVVRIVVVPPASKELRVRVETARGNDVAVRGLVMLRALLASEGRDVAPSTDGLSPSCVGPGAAGAAPGPSSVPPRSAGRAVLAVNAALFGAYTAYSVQRASGSDDPRVAYPLLALGTGVGLGTALLAAEEWDVRPGDAWTLAAGAWWGAGAGILANGREVKPFTDRYNWGIVGGFAGVALATAALARGHVDDGGAAMIHSGAAVGLGLGGVVELLSVGSLDATPSTGAGYGAIAGLVSAGALATFVRVSPSRVFLVDLGAGLGSLAGAAVASPLLFENTTAGRTRTFLGATVAGTVAGAALSIFLTRDRPQAPPPPARKAFEIMPTGGVIAESQTPKGPVPAYGVGVHGAL